MKKLAATAAALLATASISFAQQAGQNTDDVQITAPIGDGQNSGPIVRPAPNDEALPAGTVPDSAQLPAGSQENSTKPTLPPRKLTKEELDAIRQGMVDQSVGTMLKPDEVGRIRDAALGSQSAAVRPTYSEDPYPQATPRVVNAAKTPMQTPPTVRLAFGLQTPVTFVDSNGFPWPIASVTYNPAMLAQDGNGCGNNNAAAQSVDGSRPTTINLTPCYFEVFGNINVALQDWTFPVVLVTQSGFRPKGGGAVSVDMPLTVVIEGRSPLAEKVKPVSIKKRTGSQNYVKKQREPVVTGDDDLAFYISGRPPRGARSVGIGAPGVRGYVAPDGDLVVVGRIEMLTPHYSSRASTPDGEKAYRFDGVPYRVFFSDRNGTEVGATVSF